MIKIIYKALAILVLTTSLVFSMSVSQLNKASKEELLKINGIGDKKADAIIKYRKSKPFKSISDVEEVKGVGKALAKNIKNDVYKKVKTTKKKKETKKDTKIKKDTKTKPKTTTKKEEKKS